MKTKYSAAIAAATLAALMAASPVSAKTSGPGDTYLAQIAQAGVQHADDVPAANVACNGCDIPGLPFAGGGGSWQEPAVVVQESTLGGIAGVLAAIVISLGGGLVARAAILGRRRRAHRRH